MPLAELTFDECIGVPLTEAAQHGVEAAGEALEAPLVLGVRVEARVGALEVLLLTLLEVADQHVHQILDGRLHSLALSAASHGKWEKL